MPSFAFIGHSKTKQNLMSEGEDACVLSAGRWARGEVRRVTDDLARTLRMTGCFHEVPDEEPPPQSPAQTPAEDVPSEAPVPVPPAEEAAPDPSTDESHPASGE